MKSKLLGKYWAVSLLVVMALGCDKLGGGGKVETDTEKVSYAIGQQIGQQLKSQGMEVDTKVIGMAIEDVVKGNKLRLTPEEAQKAMMNMREKMMSKMQTESKENLEKGQKFLDENKTKDGVKVTKSGLQYKVVEEGKGKSPKDKDTVKVHYKGTLIDGKEFDSSYSRNQPAEFPVNAVIAGWTEALKMMKTGAKWKLFIPANLAYGEMGRPGIPGNSTLLFDVELLEIKGAEKAAKKGPGKEAPGDG